MNEIEQHPTEDEIRDLLPGFVLEILEADELVLVENYLSLHPEMWQEVKRLERTSGQLAYLAPPARLSPTVRGAVIARAQNDAASALESSSTPFQAQSRAHSGVGSNPLRSRSAHSSRQSRRRRDNVASPPKAPLFERLGGWWRTAFVWKVYALTATAALVLLTLIYFQFQEGEKVTDGRLAGLEEEIATLRTQNELLLGQESQWAMELEALALENDRLQTLNEDLLTQNREIQKIWRELQDRVKNQERILASLPSIQQLVSLEGDQFGSDASGFLVATSAGNFLVLTGLEPLPADQTYQLWLVPNGEETPISSGLVSVESSDTVVVPVELAIGANEFSAVGFSVEPAGGSPAPTQIVLFG